MKVNYIADDGKVFTSREDALKYEAAQKSKKDKNEEIKKELMNKIEKNNNTVDDYKKKIIALLDENDKLLEEYKKYLDPDQQKTCDKINEFLSVLFGD